MSLNVIDSFLVALGFEADTHEAKEFGEQLEKLTISFGELLEVVGFAEGGIGLFVAEVAEAMDKMYDFAEIENVSAEAMTELGYAAQLSGSSVDAMKGSVSGLNRVMGEAILGIGRGAMIFQRLRLSAKNADGSVKSVDQMLGDVADRMKGMSRQGAIAMAEKLGIDRSLIPMLLKGRDAIEDLRNEAKAFGADSEESFETAHEFSESMKRTTFVLKNLMHFVAVAMMPTMQKVVDGLRNWVLKNKELIAQRLETFFHVVTTVLEIMWTWLVRVTGAVTDLISWLTQFKMVTWLVTAAVTALTALNLYRWVMSAARAFMALDISAMLIPIAIGLVILAIGLLVDEIINFKEGNESFLGDLVAKYPQLLDVFNEISDGIQAMIVWVESMWEQLKPQLIELGMSLIKLFKVLWPIIKELGVILAAVFEYLIPLMLFISQAFVEGITVIIGWLVELVNWLVNLIADIISVIVTMVQDVTTLILDIVFGVRDAFMAVFKWLEDKFDAVIGKIKKAASWVAHLIGLSDDASGGGITAAAQNSPSSVNAPSSAANDAAAAPSMWAIQQDAMTAKSGPLGVAAQPSRTQTTQVTQDNSVKIAGGITVVSPDPAKAGDAVQEMLDDRTRQAVRNGQSAVAL